MNKNCWRTESAAACRVTWSPHSPALFIRGGWEGQQAVSPDEAKCYGVGRQPTWTSSSSIHHMSWGHIPHRSQGEISAAIKHKN